ncbi:MAG: hypothetical protein ACFFE6_07835 [Candidatus Thorarchaeota archaeon]
MTEKKEYENKSRVGSEIPHPYWLYRAGRYSDQSLDLNSAESRPVGHPVKYLEVQP